MISNFKDKLPVRFKNAVKGAFRSEKILDRPDKIAKFGKFKLSHIRCLGEKTLKAVARLLLEEGVIADISSWMNEIPEGYERIIVLSNGKEIIKIINRQRASEVASARTMKEIDAISRKYSRIEFKM